MPLADKIREVWKPRHLTDAEVDALIDRTELALDTVSPEAVDAFCRAVGIETGDKRGMAAALVAARQLMDAAKTFLPLLF